MSHKNEDDIEFENFGEESEDDLLIDNLDAFNQAVVWGTDWTTETIVNQLIKGNLNLNPSFQRRDAWDNKDKSRLIESLILGLPVPPIILAERKDVRNSYIVIDGKQRLLALRQFCATSEDEFDKLELKNLDHLRKLNGATFEDLSENPDFENYKTSFENQSIRTIVIKNWPNEAFLFTVFLRLNTGSKKLSPQELRQALHPGPFLTYIDEVTSESLEFRKILRNNKPDSRMRDVELAIRYFAYEYNFTNFKGNMKEFLDSTCEKLNSLWKHKEDEIVAHYSNLEHAIEVCFEIFGKKEAFSRYKDGIYNKRFNRALYEVFTYFFSNKEIRDKILKDKQFFKKQFEHLSENDLVFIDSISSTTKDMRKTVYRFNEIGEIIKEITEYPVPRFEIKNGTIHKLVPKDL
ncbi:DUF262 domain-containing protein [Priestia aryabhattai]|uniref:DUF262 domain-containing protein n=1 Tax=Priestia aryabhattai TaxID=412384 RepID=UPI003D298785